jgi:hypothetical protein
VVPAVLILIAGYIKMARQCHRQYDRQVRHFSGNNATNPLTPLHDCPLIKAMTCI